MSLDSEKTAELKRQFPDLANLPDADMRKLVDGALHLSAKPGVYAYREGDTCKVFILRLGGCSRVQKTFESGREIMLYRVVAGEACVLTTSCLLSHTLYPAESVVEETTDDVALPADFFETMMRDSEPFRAFVLQDYGRLIGNLMSLIQEIKFQRMDVRVAKWLLDRPALDDAIESTHQRIAAELGSSREVVSRLLKDFEKRGWLELSRSQIRILEKNKLGELAHSTD